jgi:hypothetical protein
LGMAVSFILSTWPTHCILCAFINLTAFSPSINLHNSLLYFIRHTACYLWLTSLLFLQGKSRRLSKMLFHFLFYVSKIV